MTNNFTVSGDAEHLYVTDREGRIVATCADLADAEQTAAGLNARDIGDCECGKPLMWSRFNGRYIHTDNTRSCRDAD